MMNTYGDELQKFAVKDYDYVMTSETTQSNGLLRCFCENEITNDIEKALSSSYG